MKTTHFDFLKFRIPALGVSAVFLLMGIGSLLTQGLNYGIDFAGGTEIQLKFAEAPSINELRERLATINLADSILQRYGDVADHEILVRTATISMEHEGETQDISQIIQDILHTDNEHAAMAEGRVDLNLIDTKTLAGFWITDPDDEAANAVYNSKAQELSDYRKVHHGLFANYEQVRAAAADLTDEEFKILNDKTFLGSFAMQRIERVGPKVGDELRKKAILATVLSLLMTLLYLWYRFEFRFSIGAIAAAAHDTLFVFGALSLFQISFNLTVVAAILTIVGYSLNDTIVVFDRIRENLSFRRRETLYSNINMSINQMLLRTILTSLTTLVVVLGLFFYGGAVVRGFSATLLIGIVVGTYSSNFIASPILYYWEQVFSVKGKAAKASGAKL